MSGFAIPSLLVVAGICLYAGASHFFLALRRRIVTHGLLGMMCLLACGYALCATHLYRATTAHGYISAARQQLLLGDLWNILFVWFVAFYSAFRSARFLLAHNAFCIFIVILNWSLPYTLLFSEIYGLESRVLPWGERVQTVAAIASPLTPLAYSSYLLSFGFAIVCCYRLLRQQTYVSAAFLAAAADR